MKAIFALFLVLAISNFITGQHFENPTTHNFQNSKDHISQVNNLMLDTIDFKYYSLNQTNIDYLFIKELEDTTQIFSLFKSIDSLSAILESYPEQRFITDMVAYKDEYDFIWFVPGSIGGEQRFINDTDTHIKIKTNRDRYFQVSPYRSGYSEINKETGKRSFKWTDYYDVSIIQTEGNYISVQLPNRIAKCKMYADSTLQMEWKHNTSQPRFSNIQFDLSNSDLTIGACNHGDTYTNSSSSWELSLEAYDQDRFDIFLKGFTTLLQYDFPFYLVSPSQDPLVMMDTLGLDLDAFLIGLLTLTKSSPRNHSYESIGRLIANSKYCNEIFNSILDHSQTEGLDRYNKTTLMRTLSNIIWFTKDEKTKAILKRKL